jgi:transcriptional regulator GlxA family with amidase domain
MKDHLNVAVLVFDGVELVDMNGPVDVFLHANRYKKDPAFTGLPYNVYTVADKGKDIISEDGAVTIKPSFTFSNCPDPDLIVIPGRISADGTDSSIPAEQPYLDFIAKMGAKNKVIMSVCVGLYSLASTGLLNDKKATTHYLSIAYAEKTWKKVKFIKNVRYVEDGPFVTTGGITSGIDGALYLVKKYNSDTIAQNVANIMVYQMDAPIPPNTILPLKNKH